MTLPAFDWHLVAFVLLAVTTLGAAYRVVTAPRIAHGALFLALSFVGVAGIFLLLGADFLAGTQVLVYVGAVVTLIVFAIMLSEPDDVRGRGSPAPKAGGANLWLGILAGVAGLGFAAVMAAVYRSLPVPAQIPPSPGPTTVPLGRELFTTYAVPFEIASIVLLAALVGATYLATREGGGKP
ncbi:MAG TPA: NADH-quinone oxidoreductase subunit J [Firmicutes bacterium]|nr:NADH-quinone oxidoreductase subunit J [Bacillota bacterium]